MTKDNKARCNPIDLLKTSLMFYTGLFDYTRELSRLILHWLQGDELGTNQAYGVRVLTKLTKTANETVKAYHEHDKSDPTYPKTPLVRYFPRQKETYDAGDEASSDDDAPDNDAPPTPHVTHFIKYYNKY